MLDTNTLLLVQVCQLLLATLFISVVFRQRFPVRGPGWWLLGFAAASLGLLLLALRSDIPVLLSIVAGNLLIFLNFVLLWNGMRLFTGQPGFQPRHVAAFSFLALAYGLFLFYYSAYQDDIRLRIYTTALLLAFCSSGIGMDLLRNGERRLVNSMAAGVFLTYGFCMVFRCCLLFFAPTWSGAPWSGRLAGYFMLASSLLLLAVTISMILMVSERLRRRIEEQNEKLTQDLRFREEVQAIMRHDLKGPLLPVVYLPDLITTIHDPPQPVRDKLMRMKAAGLSVMEQINRSIDVFKIEQGSYELKREPCNLARLLRELAMDLFMLSEQHEVQLELFMGEDGRPGEAECEIQADPVLLYSLFANLLRNAVEASPPRGLVTLALSEEGEGLCVEIENQGEVPPELRERVFEKYTTAGKEQGTGLGAYTARLAAEAHNGRVSLDTTRQGRTRVQVFLPRE